MPSSKSDSSDPTSLAAEIVSAFVANNSLPLAELPGRSHRLDQRSLVDIPTRLPRASDAGSNDPPLDVIEVTSSARRS